MRTRMLSTGFLRLWLLVPVLGLAACAIVAEEPDYVPGLGEIMTLNQMRHAKLWFAGNARNWPLAAYEVDELEEGFADAAQYHPTHKEAPVRIDQTIAEFTATPLHELRKAIEQKDKENFVHAFDELTASCNACHRATEFEFNVVRRPTRNTFTNQDFSAVTD